MDIEKFDRRMYRFLATIFKFLPKIFKPQLIKTSARIFEVHFGQMLYRINREMGRDSHPSALPRCVISDLEEDTEAHMAERNKLEVIKQLVLDGEDFEYLLQLVDEPVITYCRACKQLEYERGFYMSHGITDAVGTYMCSSHYYVDLFNEN